VDLREEVLDVIRQTCITKDGASVTVTMLVFIRVIDPEKAARFVTNYRLAARGLAVTALRAVAGDLVLAELLPPREQLGSVLQARITKATERWGIRVNAVEIREVAAGALQAGEAPKPARLWDDPGLAQAGCGLWFLTAIPAAAIMSALGEGAPHWAVALLSVILLWFPALCAGALLFLVARLVAWGIVNPATRWMILLLIGGVAGLAGLLDLLL
jgi:hypothetical protein